MNTATTERVFFASGCFWGIFELVPVTKKLITGVFTFIVGVIINELLLMLHGVVALTYNSIPLINILLVIAAVIYSQAAV